MATPEENKAAALERAATLRLKASEAAAKGNTAQMEMYQQQATTWDASAERYDRIIEAQQKIATAKENIAKIKDRIDNPVVVQGTPNPTPEIPKGITPKSAALSFYSQPNNNINQSQPTVTPTQTVASTPSVPIIPTTPAVKPQVKSATPDIVLFNDDAVPIETMTDLIFENIGGQELINIARTDTINGQQISYQPIKNLTAIQQQYNPNNILGLQTTSDKYFSNFSIKLENKTPSTGPNVYIEDGTGDLIIDVVNTADDERVEIEISISGTIYEVNL